MLIQIYSDSEWVTQEIEKYDLYSMVEFCGFVSQSDSLGLMKGADTLLLMQTIKEQGSDVVSGKVYEYLASGTPIFGIIPENGGDAWLLDMTSNVYVSFELSAEFIAEKLAECVERWGKKEYPVPNNAILERFTRRNLASQLAVIFNDVMQK